jgi:hypothetical protein
MKPGSFTKIASIPRAAKECARILKMTSLAVFDFDRTIVDSDSDATIINKLREKKTPPEWDSESGDWTPYMSNVSLFLIHIRIFLTFKQSLLPGNSK